TLMLILMCDRFLYTFYAVSLAVHFFLYSDCGLPDFHAFPTRRSSDLLQHRANRLRHRGAVSVRRGRHGVLGAAFRCQTRSRLARWDDPAAELLALRPLESRPLLEK